MSVFIKTIFKATFDFSDILKIAQFTLNHVNNIECVASDVKFNYMAFTRRMKSVFITALFYIGEGGAVFTSAPKRTGIIILARCYF